MAKEFGRLKNIANVGDIILIAGYGALEFQVETVRFEKEINAYLEANTISYDVVDLQTYQYVEAYQEDISVICRADKAEEYLRNKYEGKSESKTNPPHASSLDMDFGWATFPDLGAGWEWVVGMDFTREEEKPLKADEKYSKERADELLDEMRSYKTMIEVYGADSEKGKEFAEKIKTIESTLRYMTGGTKG